MQIESNNEYKTLIMRHAPASPTLKNCVIAFLVGGFLCFLGEWLHVLFVLLGVSEERSYVLTTLFFIILSSLLTSLGIFDSIAKRAGAGTLLPVTGFANSITSAAIDSRSEGFVLGVGSKIFTVAGPVILYATVAGTVWGIIYCLYILLS